MRLDTLIETSPESLTGDEICRGKLIKSETARNLAKSQLHNSRIKDIFIQGFKPQRKPSGVRATEQDELRLDVGVLNPLIYNKRSIWQTSHL